jgi:hypothetical protein
MPAVWPTIVGTGAAAGTLGHCTPARRSRLRARPTVNRRSARACPKPPVGLDELKSRAFDNDRGAHAPPDGRLPVEVPSYAWWLRSTPTARSGAPAGDGHLLLGDVRSLASRETPMLADHRFRGPASSHRATFDGLGMPGSRRRPRSTCHASDWPRSSHSRDRVSWERSCGSFRCRPSPLLRSHRLAGDHHAAEVHGH